MKIEEIASRLATIKKRLQALDLHTLTLRVEEVENLIEEYTSQLWTSPCICPNDEKTGETLCCNHCGKPTARTSEELPGDDKMIIEILNRIVIHSKNLRSYEGGHGVVVALANECLILLNDKHDLLASKDARIRELEEENKKLKDHINPPKKDSFFDGFKVGQRD